MNSIKYYDENALEFFNNTAFADMKELYDKFLKYLNKSAHILDAGCGSGRDTKYFLDMGFKVTAIDASEEMTKLSSNFTGQKTIKMRFEEMNFKNEFDAIWACASLLHVPKTNIKEVLDKFSNSLKDNGIIFASFKYGDGQEIRGGRLFNNYNENTLKKLIDAFPLFTILDMWKTKDVREERKNEDWISVIIKKWGRNGS
ncbi:Methyltransferase domain-containing protein [Caloramator quimbayensis]|uniref:Methyltransferase domain-containing protein n=1 Tax=Caloramator quimbayensis TaxID=1147123 RepID=A0A1T4XTZ9_9CLOT|nr:class I SAM-dependent methyltransferase [Caloramator quimbayensis]SKA92873.1 Methyltransferase domain-containing protein [Caloramator quimbayensis]